MKKLQIPLDFTHRTEIKNLAEKLGPADALALSVALLLFVAKEEPLTGALKDDPAILEMKLLWTGRRGMAVKALLDAGLIEKVEQGFKVTGWESDHGYFKIYRERAKKGGLAKNRKTGVLDGA